MTFQQYQLAANMTEGSIRSINFVQLKLAKQPKVAADEKKVQETREDEKRGKKDANVNVCVQSLWRNRTNQLQSAMQIKTLRCLTV